MRNLTPLHLRCHPSHCPSIRQMDGGEYLIVGRSATMAAACEDIPVGEGEHPVIISGELLGNVVPAWMPIAEADKGREIIASQADGRPIVLQWLKYNGLEAWRDWDNDPHEPEWFIYPPLPPAEKVEA